MLKLLVGKLNSEQGTERAYDAFSTVAAPANLTASLPCEGKAVRHEATIIRSWHARSGKDFRSMNYQGIDLNITSPYESPLGRLPHCKR